VPSSYVASGHPQEVVGVDVRADTLQDLLLLRLQLGQHDRELVQPSRRVESATRVESSVPRASSTEMDREFSAAFVTASAASGTSALEEAQLHLNDLYTIATEGIDTAIATTRRESKPVYISVSCNLVGLSHPTFSREPVPLFKSFGGPVDIVKNDQPYVLFDDSKRCVCRSIDEDDEVPNTLPTRCFRNGFIFV
jgi:hypothetical protein